ncbi:SDR family NAD(P)-dependent oxidoreductase [Pseudomonas sp. ODNR1LW]|nr:SDR family NAD(P)-dependent oxidoreductase [Pseudomonas sp. ODNR1LW]
MRAKPVLKPLGDQSIVITGATSGVGLATARRAAWAGARVFLIAGGEADLRALCEELQAQGARVAWAVADVADAEALKAAADKCVRLFGGFDTWVNNAGVGLFGSIRETSLEDQRRLFETNYWGVVNGAAAAVEHLRHRPGGGAIINVGSILSDLPLPVQGIYAASKHAVKGFTNALRLELLRDGAPVSVSLVKPGAIDTPLNRHARNLTGQAMRNPQPVYATHVVADTILYCAAHPIREITVGGGGRLIASLYAALPGIAEPLLARFAPSMMRDPRSAYRPYDDGLYDPTEDGLEEEVHYPMVRNFSALAEVRKHPGVSAGTLAALLAGAGLAIYLSQRSGPTRYQRIKTRIDPRGWVDAAELRGRLHDAVDILRHRADDAGERAGEWSREARHRAVDTAKDARTRADEWFRATGEGSRKVLKSQSRKARRYADEAGVYAREHVREGGALLAVATLAAVVGAAVLESRRPDSHVRRIARF